MKENKEISLSVANAYLAIGADLMHIDPVDQLEAGQYVASQIGDFALSVCGGFMSSVDIVSGFMQITVECDNPDQALTDFLSMLSSGKIDIPENNGDDPVFQYAVIGEGDPVLFMFDMIDQVNGEDFICDDCLKAMAEDEAAMNVKH